MAKYQVWTNDSGVLEFDSFDEYRTWFLKSFGDFGLKGELLEELIRQHAYEKSD